MELLWWRGDSQVTSPSLLDLFLTFPVLGVWTMGSPSTEPAELEMNR